VIRAPEAIRQDIRPLFASPSVRLVRSRVIESLEDVDEALDRAKAVADATVEQAKRDARELREEAREQGRAEGMDEVLAQLAKARREYEELLAGAEQDMLDMAFRLARRIIGEAIEVEPERVRQMVANVLGHARGKREIVVQVAPADLEVLEASSGEFSSQVDGVRVYFEAEPALERGSCVIQTETGHIDGRIETQLETLKRALQGG
jgi:type III secretion protein L